ncbi:MAG: hypothetical protein KC964_02035 [Candidatus Omnitrophica bacterium]|nr:hypothetical protein [Candidatus Omnitrophota bacterium]
MPEKIKEYFTTGELGALLGLTKDAVNKRISAKKLFADKRTDAGFNLFHIDSVNRILKEEGKPPIEGVELQGEPIDVGHTPLSLPDIRNSILKRIESIMATQIRQQELITNSRNVVRVDVVGLTGSTAISSSSANTKKCPYVSVQRLGDMGFSLLIAFENPPTVGHSTEAIMEWFEKDFGGVRHVLRRGFEDTYRSSFLTVYPLRRNGWFWISIRGFEYILSLPHDPSKEEWERYAVKVGVHYQSQARKGPVISLAPPPFRFKTSTKQE